MKKYKVDIDGVVVEGEAINIVKYLKTQRFEGDNVDLEEWLTELSTNIFRFYNKSIFIDNTKEIKEQCEDFMEQIYNHKLLYFLDKEE